MRQRNPYMTQLKQGRGSKLWSHRQKLFHKAQLIDVTLGTVLPLDNALHL